MSSTAGSSRLRLGLVMAVFWRFFDRRVGEPWFDPARLQAQASGLQLRPIAAAAVAIAALPMLWSSAVGAAGTAPPPSDIAFPELRGWQRIGAGTARPWQPSFVGADIVRLARYRDAAGREVDLAIAVFARQAEGRELVGHGHAPPGGERLGLDRDSDGPPQGRTELLASHRLTREVSASTGSAIRSRVSAMKVKLETRRRGCFGGPAASRGGSGVRPGPGRPHARPATMPSSPLWVPSSRSPTAPLRALSMCGIAGLFTRRSQAVDRRASGDGGRPRPSRARRQRSLDRARRRPATRLSITPRRRRPADADADRRLAVPIMARSTFPRGEGELGAGATPSRPIGYRSDPRRLAAMGRTASRASTACSPSRSTMPIATRFSSPATGSRQTAFLPSCRTAR